jgi:hypothetical protein
MRQGPHHGAQKSTRTGTGLLRTSFSKLASVTSAALDIRKRAGRRVMKRI